MSARQLIGREPSIFDAGTEKEGREGSPFFRIRLRSLSRSVGLYKIERKILYLDYTLVHAL